MEQHESVAIFMWLSHRGNREFWNKSLRSVEIRKQELEDEKRKIERDK